jgi:DedD protein
MNDHNLDDLIIEDEHLHKSDKTKGILTILALLIVVLIIVIVLTKVILKEPKVDAIVIDESAQLRSHDLKKLQPKPKAKNDTDTTQDSKYNGDSLNEEIDTTLDTDTKSEEKPSELQKPVVVTKPKPAQTPKHVSKPKPIHTPKPVHASKPIHKPTVKKVTITDEFEQTRPVSKPKTVNRPKPVQKPKAAQSTSQKYYIQVGSYSQEPSGNYLKIIKNSGFNYTVISSGGRKKLLVGPYGSRSAVDSALPKVRDRINKGAFVYKVK